MTYYTDFEKDNYIIKVLGSGAEGTVYASIPKAIADHIFAELTDPCDPLDSSTAETKLRAALEAAKIPKGSNSNDFRHEMEVLKVLSKDQHPNIVALKTANSSNSSWLVLEPLAGGDLIHFRERIRESSALNPLLLGLAWHFIHDLVAALLAMHTQNYAHRDVLERNVMLRPRGIYKDYPDLVLGDFGNACDYGTWLTTSHATDTPALRREFLGLYERDLRSLGFILQYSFDRVIRNNAPLDNALKRIKGYRIAKGDGAKERHVRILTQLRDEAFKGREKEYKVLPEALDAYFKERANIVSDEELEKVFPDLARRKDE